MEPEIVYLIVCDAVEIDPLSFHRIAVRGLLARLWSHEVPPFPITRPEFSAFAMFTGGQGVVRIAVRVVSDAAGQTVFRTVARRFRFAGQPSDVLGATFRIRGCPFPVAGLTGWNASRTEP